jgi:predicted phage terminase large subunit-like protein
VWSWLVDPSHKWLCASYALSLSIRDNRKCRLLIESPWFQQTYGKRFRISDDQNVKMKFENNKRGVFQAVSVGSSATGEGADTLLIDDPHAIDDKTSDIKREGALEWFRDTWSTRLNNPQTGAMVVVGQRIHAKDLSGWILSGETGEEWVHLNLPAEYEPEQKCETRIDGSIFWQDWREEEGELLWPNQFPENIIQIAKKKHGAMGFAALFQQRPVPAGGGQFKKQWFRYFTTENDYYQLETDTGIKRFLMKNCWLFMTEDLAISTKQTADYTVMCVWAVTPDKDLLLIARLRERLDNPGQQQQTSVLYQRYHPNFIKIESIAYQLALVQQLRRQGLPVKEYKPVKDKVSRASTAAVYYESSKVFHPKHASWLHEWEDELLLFPLGSHDDQVDNASMACEELGMPRSVGGMVVHQPTEEEQERQAYEEEDDLALWR